MDNIEKHQEMREFLKKITRTERGTIINKWTMWSLNLDFYVLKHDSFTALNYLLW